MSSAAGRAGELRRQTLSLASGGGRGAVAARCVTGFRSPPIPVLTRVPSHTPVLGSLLNGASGTGSSTANDGEIGPRRAGVAELMGTTWGRRGAGIMEGASDGKAHIPDPYPTTASTVPTSAGCGCGQGAIRTVFPTRVAVSKASRAPSRPTIATRPAASAGRATMFAMGAS